MASSGAHRPRNWRDWAGLDAGPAGLVAEHVLRNDVVDFVRFRAACRAWRACSAHLRAQGVLDRRFHPRRWIMLPETFNVRGRRRLFNVFTGKSVYKEVPVQEPRRRYLLTATSEGLVLLLGNHDGQLLNLLTGQATGLPGAASLLDIAGTLSDLELHGTGLADDDTVVLQFRSFCLAVAKPGDERWTRVYSRDRIMSILPFAGRVYCATSRNISLVETTTTANQPPQLVAVADHKKHTDAFKIPMYNERTRMLLVENNGELILCLRARPEPHIQGTLTSCGVYQVDLDGKKMLPLRGLGGKVLFLGRRRSLMAAAGVSPSINGDTAYLCYPSPKDDPIYAIDLLGGGHVEPKFAKDDAAYCLSCYVIDDNRECI